MAALPHRPATDSPGSHVSASVVDRIDDEARRDITLPRERTAGHVPDVRLQSSLRDQLSGRGVKFHNANLLPSVIAHVEPINIPPIVTGNDLAEVLGIPAKLNANSEGKPYGIPG
jgi:hypothetical protein